MLYINGRESILEVIEAALDLLDEINQELCYYRASVYKTESAIIINAKIKKLESVCLFIKNDELIDYFSDFRATIPSGNSTISPGECTFSLRVGKLMTSLRESINDMRSVCSMTQNRKDEYPHLSEKRLTNKTQLHRP